MLDQIMLDKENLPPLFTLKEKKLRTRGLIDFHQKRKKEMDKSNIRRSHGSR